MSDNTIALPKHDADLIDEPDADAPLYLVTANGENGLQTEVVDVRGKVPAAFPPRSRRAHPSAGPSPTRPHSLPRSRAGHYSKASRPSGGTGTRARSA